MLSAGFYTHTHTHTRSALLFNWPILPRHSKLGYSTSGQSPKVNLWESPSIFALFKMTIFGNNKYEQDGKALNMHLQQPSWALTKSQYDSKCRLTKIRKRKDMSWNCCGRTFTGRTPFLSPNQQHQHTEGRAGFYKEHKIMSAAVLSGHGKWILIWIIWVWFTPKPTSHVFFLLLHAHHMEQSTCKHFTLQLWIQF